MEAVVTTENRVDPLEGEEVKMLNAMLAKVYPAARDGEPEAIDRVLKILQLKRLYRQDRLENEDEWRL